MEELRNTVVNLLEALVQKGVMTREQAQAMVANAQSKAATDAKAKADEEVTEKDAVRVTHVPQIVRDDISKQVSAELKPQVTQEVIAQAKAEKWGVPGALPDWLSGIRLFGDLRLRSQYDTQEMPTVPAECIDADHCLVNFQALNDAGSFTAAGESAYRNITTDRFRERIRLRTGLEAKITDGISVTTRLASGNAGDPVSTNQTLGQDATRFTITIDQAYLRFAAGSNKALPWMTVVGGRNPNPFLSTDLVWDPDLGFDGVAGTWRINLGGAESMPLNTFVTLGGFPLQEIALSTRDKWLYGGQLGLDWPWDGGGRFKIAGAYYYFDNITGHRNEVLGSTLFDYTAPQSMQKGNTLFDIRNDNDPDTGLYALAAEYRLVDVTAMLELPIGAYKLLLTGDYVRNIGYDKQDVLARGPVNSDGNERNTGYQAELGFGTGTTGKRGNWRAYLAYKHLERDAVVDAYTDSDFNLGGTDAKGYILRGEWWFRDRTSVGLRYLSSDSIDSVPVNVDVAMLDVSANF